MPAALSYILLKYSRITSGICVAVAILLMTLYLDLFGGLAIVLMLSPAVVPLLLIRWKRKFWESALIMAGIMFGATMVTLCVGYLFSGSDLIDAGMRYVFQLMRSVDTQMIDAVISPLSILGIIGPGAELLPVPPDIRETLLVQLEGLMAQSLRNDMPSIIIIGCGFGGLLGTFLTRFFLRTQGYADVDFPDIAEWRMNRRTRDGVSAAFLLTVAGTFFGVTFLADVYDTVCEIVFFICAVQGASVAEYYMRYHGIRKIPRRFSILAVAIFFRIALSIVGMLDMYFNIRKRFRFAGAVAEQDDNNEE